MVARMFKTRIDISVDAREKLIGLLNQQLADTLDLMTQTKQAHWNVKGPQFIALHKLFDEMADTLNGHLDTIAERINALGGLAQGTARLAAVASRLAEFPLDAVQDMAVVTALSERYAAYGATTRAAIDSASEFGDLDTADLFTEVSRDVDKHLWFLEAHLQV